MKLLDARNVLARPFRLGERESDGVDSLCHKLMGKNIDFEIKNL